MKTLLMLLVMAAVLLLAVAVVATLLVLIAAALGSLLMRLLPLATLEAATVIALIALIAAAVFVWRFYTTFRDVEARIAAEEEEDEVEDDEDWVDDEGDFADDAEEEEAPVDFIPAIPRWRQPLKPVSFEGVSRNAACPCGSGRKYKNCHGRSTA